MGNYRVPSPALGSAGMKYSLPVYSNKMNSKASGGNSMIEGLCYGRGYSSVPARSFPVDSSVTTGNASSLEDTISRQFKDTSNVQISGQQVYATITYFHTEWKFFILGLHNLNAF
jgi:hypothetical protein